MSSGFGLGRREEQVKSYVIEGCHETWVVRLFDRRDPMISGPTVDSAKGQAFDYVRQAAPCRIQVIADESEEWILADPDGEWERVIGQPCGSGRE
jgi:hypothetical protein